MIAMAQRRRTGTRTHRRYAIEVLGNTLFTLGGDGFDRTGSRRIAAEFVDALTDHVIDTIDARDRGAKLIERSRRGGK